MNVACPECRSVFRVDPAKVVGVNLRARCAVCGGIIPVGASVRWSDDFGAGTAPAFVRQPEAASPRAPAAAATARPPATESPAPAPAVVDRPTTAAPPPRPKVAVPSAPQPDLAAAIRPAPVAGPATPPPPARSATPIPPVAPVTYPRPAEAPPATRRPINPFLANDPNQKARRLARALVSDMIAYHPRKRDEGLRDGTLKQLFREEIKKSYEEYSEQVGREFAESTSHFQDALNEVLAGGKKVF
ncbi:MAG: zinc-ribbon domain-containing protein [Gemmatimonadaceae bacterium]